ncbi:MAG: hypothetical protein QM778_13970 [Myxococcales bacterium]
MRMRNDLLAGGLARFDRLLGRLLLLACAWLPRPVEAQSLIKGVDEWAEATTKSAAPKWAGPRVVFPTPQPRPASIGRLTSLLWPLDVHLAAGVPLARGQAVLEAGEEALAILATTGWLGNFGDGGMGGTGGYDLYVTPQASHGADAFLDATEPMWGLDGARAFGVVDARVPSDRIAACTTQTLAETLLYQLDPAESASARQSTGAYLSWLVTGDLGCDDEENGRRADPRLAALGPDAGGRGAEWLVQLGHRQDQNRGHFMRDMWQFARQRTWEGTGLRASPDLFEVIAAALGNEDEQLENVASELADQQALTWLDDPPPQPALNKKGIRKVAPPPWTALKWSTLPARLPWVDGVQPLGGQYALIDIDQPLAGGERLRVWSHGEFGTRWALSLLALDGERQVIGRITAPPRKNPNSFATLELMPNTRQVLIAVTNVADGIPDADDGAPFEQFGVALTIDRGGDGAMSDALLP